MLALLALVQPGRGRNMHHLRFIELRVGSVAVVLAVLCCYIL
jgi:hypothetical protein